MIRRQKRDVAVVLSVQEYERVCALNREEFQRFCDRVGKGAAESGLTERKLAEILADEKSHIGGGRKRTSPGHRHRR